MTFKYHFGGVEIASEIPLIGLRPAREGGVHAPTMRVMDGGGEAPAEEKLHFAWNGRFQMRLGEAGGRWLTGSPWGSFAFERDASVVHIHGADGPDNVILMDLFRRRLLPRLVKLRGGATYHAASLAQDDKGVLIMGPSGAGKSTMSVGLAATEGWDILGDDMALIWNDGAETISPAAADVTIWPQSCAGLQLPEEDCEPLLGYDGKRVYHPRRARRLDPVPLEGIFFLNRSPDCAAPVLERRTRAEAFQRALRQIIYFNPNGDAAEERIRSVTRLNTILGRVPAWTLTYPASFDALHAVSNTLSAALRDG